MEQQYCSRQLQQHNPLLRQRYPKFYLFVLSKYQQRQRCNVRSCQTALGIHRHISNYRRQMHKIHTDTQHMAHQSISCRSRRRRRRPLLLWSFADSTLRHGSASTWKT
ncbi:unnamed protein product [Ceratitis capitata]|uniref:(Mediterranean fruit fly) hypothetical protein n=1 Tax=Ceratitis capitata TaxID=7213 RepID=A0A811TX88_CERCA|nr:unnamed protein product [Ceratitis capitata]